MNIRTLLTSLALIACLITPLAFATETENIGIRILPTPGKVVVDGKFNDWDLTGGIFACGDVEGAAETYSVWFHTMWDKDNLYLLARWNDPTPMSHPGSVVGDYGFNGDCLQVRVVTAPDVTDKDVTNLDRNKPNDAPLMRTNHITAWRDREGIDVIDLAWGWGFKDANLKDAKTEGGAQAYHVHEDGKGYTQEISIPWKLLKKEGVDINAGTRILMTVEPNFRVATGARLTIKDVFKPDVTVDRIFTFQSNRCWGYATLEANGNVTPSPLRLSDRREFPVRMEQGLPVIDWTGLTKSILPQGFKSIKLKLEKESNVSLNIYGPDGAVARQLLTNHHFAKGEHDIAWDGLTTMSVRKPGQVLPAGDYTWQAIAHDGIGLKLRGWAANSGKAPWHGWGADHGNPQSVATAGEQVFIGWSGGEGDKPLQASDLDGNIQWKNIRGGIASAGPVATDGTTVYAFNNVGQYAKQAIYRVEAKTGRYTEWSSLKTTDLTMRDLWGEGKDIPEQPTAIAATQGKVFVSFHSQGVLFVVDSQTGTTLKRINIHKIGSIAVVSPKVVLVVGEGIIVRLNVETGETISSFKPSLPEGDWIAALAVGATGDIYAGIRSEDHRIEVYGADGKFKQRIGRKGGRAKIGPWTADGVYNVSGLAVDSRNQLWVTEYDGTPRRVSVWDAKSGAFKKEYFGASSYGATGACVNPVDPNLIVGQSCEWRIDPVTGRATPVGTITKHGMGSSRFGFGQNGRLYLAVSSQFLHGTFPIYIYERLGDANYKLRAHLKQIEKEGPDKKKTKTTEIWSDTNDDAIEQPEEVQTSDLALGGWFAGWYLGFTQDMSLYGSQYQVKVTGWTSCGAPLYDLSKAVKLPGPSSHPNRGGMGAQKGLGSADGKFMLWNGTYGDDHSTVDCYDIASGKLMWTYPSNFTGVHGSHRAPSAHLGMIRGAYDITGSAKLADPVGNIWVIPTNKGEWHVLTERGFYLTRLFEGDPTRNVYPDSATPGVSLDTLPPGAGEEAFGGSITQHVDGKLSVQGGHISYWNCEVVGLEKIRALPGGKVTLTEDDVVKATTFRDRDLQESSAAKRLVVIQGTPEFSGDFDKDFAGAPVARYQKDAATAVRSAALWNKDTLFLAWEVKDATPWVNGADAPEFMYARGDTVDLQLATDSSAKADRKEAAMGDLRLSIGSYNGEPTAVIYRKIAKEKSPKEFSSGVIKGFVMESVLVVKDAKIKVKIDEKNKRYIVQAAIPLAAVGMLPRDGVVFRGDFGVTHGDKAGRDTVLRTHWSNQSTGLVSDEVFELQMAPNLWGEIEFK